MFLETICVNVRLPLILPALLATSSIAAPAPMPADLLAVQTHLRAVDSMTAQFSQSDRTGKTLGGTLTLKKPGKIRFQYEKGVPILIVGDGKALYFIDYSVRQVSRWPIGNSPLSVLLDSSKDISRFAKVVRSTNPNVISVEADDPKHPEYGRITLIFSRDAAAPGGLMMLGWVALDAQNNRTSVRLSAQRYNAAIGDGAFRWSDPRSNSRRN
ncbi:outer membrane lipoprotein carrier protein LolA [soil metagenome]